MMLRTSFGIALCILSLSPEAAKADPQEVTFGIVPQQSASRLAEMWTPFLNELSDRTGVTFRFRTTKDIPTFEACIAAGVYDFAYMNPMHYAIFSDEAEYRAIARQSNKKLKGILVAKKDGGIDHLGALDGSNVAFPSPGAFGASILTRSALSASDVSFEPQYVKSHDSVYRAVAAGLTQAGGGVLRTFGAIDPELREQLTVIYETDGYTPHAFAAQARISDALLQDVQQAMLDMAGEQPDLVKGIGMKGIEVGDDRDWDDVRALGMARDETGISEAGEIQCPSD
jgi:phosphonate transport system substrate-binding protein